MQDSTKEDMLNTGYSWKIYNVLESDFVNFTNYVPLENDLLDCVYSPRLSQIIIGIGCQIETFFVEWMNCSFSDKYPTIHEYRKRNNHIDDYIRFFEKISNLSKQEVKIKDLDISILPFGNDISKDHIPFWWTNYNNQKHKAYEKRKYATIRNTLYPLAALFVLNSLVPTHKDIKFYKQFNFSRPDFRSYSSFIFEYKTFESMLDPPGIKNNEDLPH